MARADLVALNIQASVDALSKKITGLLVHNLEAVLWYHARTDILVFKVYAETILLFIQLRNSCKIDKHVEKLPGDELRSRYRSTRDSSKIHVLLRLFSIISKISKVYGGALSPYMLFPTLAVVGLAAQSA